jgi:putative transposase
MISSEERQTCRALIDEAVAHGARRQMACDCLGICLRRLERWEKLDHDRRCTIKKDPPNRLSESERQSLLHVVNTVTYRDLSPKQIVPRLADEGVYLASESTIYRLLRESGQLAHRGRARAPVHKKPEELMAIGPNQIWSWDITYLKAPVQGAFYYLYLVLDIYSRKIVGHEVHEREDALFAAELIEKTSAREKVDKGQLVLHSDNGGPMKGATMLATLQKLGVVPSFSRPRVSDDNPFSESIFKTLKYRPSFPDGRFSSIEEAKSWVEKFVTWYNEVHLHSAINFVTPKSRHEGNDQLILAGRLQVYGAAKDRHPERWAGKLRNWDKAGSVYLNPRKEPKKRPIPFRSKNDKSSRGELNGEDIVWSRAQAVAGSHTMSSK